jgi:maleylacetoacetate isomerase
MNSLHRTALLYKGIPVTYRYINLVKHEQSAEEYTSLNPNQLVPTLIAENGSLVLTQSIAILEYLEETYPDKPLLPKHRTGRAIVRNLVNLIANDVQPVTNLRILEQVDSVGGSRAKWAKSFLQRGLKGTFPPPPSR